MASLHQHKPFTLTPEQVSRMSVMSRVTFELELQTLAQSHHYSAFPVIGVFDSLSGRPQMRDWFANQPLYMLEALAVFHDAAKRKAA